jgi:hypothetical protein
MDSLDLHNSSSLGPSDAAYTANSSLREKIIEHLFVGELLRTLWRKGARQLELLRAEVDAGGYDLVIECNGITRHIQLKSSYRGAKTSRVNINVGLQQRARGCVIWIMFDPGTMEIGPFLWLGNSPDQQTPSFGDRVARHTKGNRFGTKSERPNIRVVCKGEFKVLSGMSDLTSILFDLPENAAQAG